MKAFIVNKEKATWQDTEVATIPIPEPKGKLMRVKMLAACINPADHKLIGALFPQTLGLDGCGIVDEVGEEVKEWKKGDVVYFHNSFQTSAHGTFAEYSIVASDVVLPLPKELSPEIAASVPCAGWTAWHCLSRILKIHLPCGPLVPANKGTILITGGAGGVGTFAIQIAKRFGLRVLTTCSPKNADYVKKLGADEAIDYHKENVVARALELTEKRGVDYVFDTISGESATECVEALAFGGKLVAIAGPVSVANGWSLMKKQITIGYCFLGQHHTADPVARADLVKIGTEFQEFLLSEKPIDPMISETITIDGIADAFTKSRDHHVRGKVVIKF